MATNPHSYLKKAATNVEGVTGISSAGVFDPTEFSAKTAPVAADKIVIEDTEDANAPKVATLTNAQKILGEIAAGTNTSSGLSEVDGVLRININGTTAKTEPVAADSVVINDSEATNTNKKVTLTNLAKPIGEIFAGTNATSGLSEVDGVGRLNINGIDAKTSPVSADATVINDSADTNKNKKVTLANMAAFYGAMAQMPDDLKRSIFLTYAEFDAGTDAAVDTKLTDALEAKGQLIAVIGIVNELFNGTGDSTVIISKAATGATAMASSIVMDKDSTQLVGSVVGAWPVAGANSICASGGDVYAYVATDVTRSTGKIGFVLIWMKTA